METKKNNEEIMKINFAGMYQKNGNMVFKPDIHLLIKERKKDLIKKTKYYLLIKLNGQFKYLSSLFEIEKNKFYFDDRLHKYSFEIKDSLIEIKEI